MPSKGLSIAIYFSISLAFGPVVPTCSTLPYLFNQWLCWNIFSLLLASGVHNGKELINHRHSTLHAAALGSLVLKEKRRRKAKKNTEQQISKTPKNKIHWTACPARGLELRSFFISLALGPVVRRNAGFLDSGVITKLPTQSPKGLRHTWSTTS